MNREYFKEHILDSDIKIYQNMLRQHKAGSAEYKDISKLLDDMHRLKEFNRKRYANEPSYFSRGNPSVKVSQRVSKKQKILDELYQEKKALKQKIFNIELEIETLDKTIKEVKASKKKK